MYFYYNTNIIANDDFLADIVATFMFSLPVTSMAGLIFMNRFLFVISDVHLSILFDNNSATKNIIYKKRLLFKICIEFCVFLSLWIFCQLYNEIISI